jgi:hypothetical protein
MKRWIVLLFVLSLPAWAETGPRPATQAAANASWKFAISGDSRNCGDVVMPAIAADARRLGVAFYWHLGDARWLSRVDEDIAHEKARTAPLALADYRALAWQDFTVHQLKAWGDTPVFLGIGNHELLGGRTRADFLRTFRPWVNQPAVEALRLHEEHGAREPGTYFHWIERGLDLIYLDNASKDQFDAAQLDWLEGVLQRAEKNPEVKALLVGAHAPLPHSFGKNHAMDDWELGVSSGERAYRMLLDFQRRSGKAVTLFASHQHFYMPNIFDTPYWRANGGVLPGYIVGSGGAHRYALPPDAPAGSKTDVYGYLLVTAAPSGAVETEYREVEEGDVPPEVAARYRPGFVHWCFVANSDSAK